MLIVDDELRLVARLHWFQSFGLPRLRFGYVGQVQVDVMHGAAIKRRGFADAGSTSMMVKS